MKVSSIALTECLNKGAGSSNLLGLSAWFCFGKKCSEFSATDKWTVSTEDSDSGVRIKGIGNHTIVPAPDNK